MKIEKILTDEFKNSIKKEVQAAEKKSGGEIVVYMAQDSDDYNHIYYQTGFFTAFICLFIFLLLFEFVKFVSTYSLIFLTIALLLPFLAISLLYLIKPLRLFFIGRRHTDYYVRLKAKEAFLNNEVFKTKDRTGVMIYISLFEKKAVILADSGINAKVGNEKWDSVIREIVIGIKEHSLLHGIVTGISLCGDILKDNHVERRPDDENELDDGLKIGERK
jgi:putative membrane protein